MTPTSAAQLRARVAELLLNRALAASDYGPTQKRLLDIAAHLENGNGVAVSDFIFEAVVCASQDVLGANRYEEARDAIEADA